MMKAKYKKYLDALGGASITGSGLSSAFSAAKTSMTSVQSALSSSSYTELAATTINNITIPKIGAALDAAEASAESAVSEVSAKVGELVSALRTLESLENESDSLGGKQSYNAEKTNKASVDAHNRKVDEIKEKIAAQESSCDGIIAAINGITVDAVDIASMGVGADTSTTEEDKDKEKDETKTDGDSTPSGVLEYKVGDIPEAGRQVSGLGKRAVLLDITCDGQSLGQDGEIVIKRGQTVHLKVKVPDEIDNVKTLKRTSADGKRGWSQWVSQKNYPQVNKNDTSTYVDAREYDWYITGNTTTDNITLSQTALFSIPGAKYGSYKGMARVRVKIVD